MINALFNKVGMAIDANDVKYFARSIGADLVGIASTDRFEGAPPGHRPEDLLPDAKSVIVIAKRIPLAVVRSIPSYHYAVSVEIINRELCSLSYRVAAYLEDLGYLALPLDNETGQEYFKEGGKFRMLADLSLRHAAVLAGLGEIGAGAFLVTPRFGPRVRLVAVITTAPLRPDPMLTKEPLKWGVLCRPEACGAACIKACPAKAFPDQFPPPNPPVIDHLKCRRYRYPDLDIEAWHVMAELCRSGVSRIERDFMAAKLSSRLLGMGSGSRFERCGICIKACPIGSKPKVSDCRIAR
jgi:epoxyqueuosine reductase QueG